MFTVSRTGFAKTAIRTLESLGGETGWRGERVAADIDIIIPHYGGTDITWRCLMHLWCFAPPMPKTRIAVVDDCSPDNMPVIGKWLEKTGTALYTRHEQNLGCTNGWNTGLVMTETDRAPWVGFMNNDAAIMPGAIQRMLAVGNSGYAIVCAKDFKIESDIEESSFDPSVAIASLNGPTKIINGEYLSTFFIVRREVLDSTGGFDGTLRHTYGDTDFMIRMSKLGHGSVVVENALVYHGLSISSKRLGLTTAISMFMRDTTAFKEKWKGTGLAGWAMTATLDRGDLEEKVIKTWRHGER